MILILAVSLVVFTLACVASNATEQQQHIVRSAAFPLKVSDNRRYLVDQNSQPFLYHADTGWQLIWNLTKDEAEQYLENRKQKGFTAIQVQLLPHRVNQTNRYGHNPFTAPGDFTNPNPDYFQHVDWMLQERST